MKIADALERGAGLLESHSVENHLIDAELLLGKTLELSRAWLYANSQAEMTTRQTRQYMDLVCRRSIGYPLQYLIGDVCFAGIELEVEPGVFIPRQETEVLLERALEVIGERGEALDLCTGCGNLAIGLALARPSLKITAIDISEAAVRLAKKNVSKHFMEGRVEVLRGDLFDALDSRERKKFDVIISNPPYVPRERLGELMVEVRKFEPMGALDGGPEGLDVIRRVIEFAPFHLAQGGWLALEVDESHWDEVRREFLDRTCWGETSIFLDLAGKPRVVRACFRG